MTTRKELQEWLNNFPEDTIIEFAFQKSPSAYQSFGEVEFNTPNLTDSEIGDGWEYCDFATNQFVTEDKPYFGKKYLKLGESR